MDLRDMISYLFAFPRVSLTKPVHPRTPKVWHGCLGLHQTSKEYKHTHTQRVEHTCYDGIFGDRGKHKTERDGPDDKGKHHDVKVSAGFRGVVHTRRPVESAHVEDAEKEQVRNLDKDGRKGEGQPAVEARCILASEIQTLRHVLGLSNNNLRENKREPF